MVVGHSNEDEAQIVRFIFSLYLKEYSILAIIRDLRQQNIKSPTGKDQWSKRTINAMLANAKYTDDRRSNTIQTERGRVLETTHFSMK